MGQSLVPLGRSRLQRISFRTCRWDVWFCISPCHTIHTFCSISGLVEFTPIVGGWLNTVKVTLGFLELAFALKFLSTADLVWQAHFLERELFIAIWVANRIHDRFLSLGRLSHAFG